MTDDQSTLPFDTTGIVPPSAVEHAPVTAAPAVAELPRIRWAGIVWGALLAAVAAVALVFAVVPDRRADVRALLLDLDPSTLNPGAVVGYVILAVGVALLLIGGAAVARRATSRG
ncbi:hypothetical protein [Microbacterium sp. SLBN-146]|uniref:hypothetical protein n=1 Tax=Microbacterium sp. SLBN-146 TaxID=2768457 RepID=UPI00114DAC24|nr:hypothetical protein [Microbacterium sp. SLBN-146]TQJ29621.1 hypothetical protein FBY39_0064 [Microbacterium sp. SLBN-146]